MPRNIELKARVRDWEAAVEAAAALPCTESGLERQRDTYFPVPRGRLKLRRRWTSREITDPASLPADPFGADLWDVPIRAELIHYDRPDVTGARGSDYLLLPLDPASTLESVLDLALSREALIEKVRAVRVHDRVRIHLDVVRGLGHFLEFEAFVDDRCDDDSAAAKVAKLRGHFAIRGGDVIAGSYRELCREARRRGTG